MGLAIDLYFDCFLQYPCPLEKWGFPGGAGGKEPACQCRRCRDRFDPWVKKIPWRRAWQPSPMFLPGESHCTQEPGRLQSIGLQRVRYNWRKNNHKILGLFKTCQKTEKFVEVIEDFTDKDKRSWRNQRCLANGDFHSNLLLFPNSAWKQMKVRWEP